MKGKKITKQQIGVYMKEKKKGRTKVIAAAKAGMSERSSYYLEKRTHAVANKERSWKTRKDPFEYVWESEILPLLEKEPKLQAKTLFRDLQRKHPDEFPDSQLRTLQRRVQAWQAIHGPEKELMFRQKHPIGWQGLSDFTEGNSLEITIQRKPFAHILYHYWLPFSKWEYVEVILGGESFIALSTGLQNALWACGGVPETHRTDSLSAAYKNLSNKEKEDFTEDYLELCTRYGMEPTRNNKGVSNENGSIEASHGGLKNDIKQELLLRGSRDFISVNEYRIFVHNISKTRNRRNNKLYVEELAVLLDLPEHRSMDFQERRVRVTSSGTINVCNKIYSVPSRLVGTIIKVHLYDDHLECFTGTVLIKKMNRIRGDKKHNISYRDSIISLSRKPQAFRNYIYQEDMFPTIAFQQAWEVLDEQLDERESCREYVKILKAAAENEENEQVVHMYLEKQLLEKKIPTSKGVLKLFQDEVKMPLKTTIIEPNLASYGAFFGGRQW